MQRYILTLRCPDQPGIVHALAAGVAEAKGNILESAQFSDPGTGIFTIRVSLETPDADTESLRDELTLRLARFDPVLTVRPEEQRRRVLLMVSKFDHCLVDLLYRWRLGRTARRHPARSSPTTPTWRRSRSVTASPSSTSPSPATPSRRPRPSCCGSSPSTGSTSWCSPATCRSSPTTCAASCPAGSSTSITRSCRASRAPSPTTRPTSAASSSSAPPPTTSPPTSTRARSSSRTSSASGTRQTAPELVAIGRDVERIVLARAVRLHAEDRVVLTGSRTVVFS